MVEYLIKNQNLEMDPPRENLPPDWLVTFRTVGGKAGFFKSGLCGQRMEQLRQVLGWRRSFDRHWNKVLPNSPNSD